MALGIYFCPPRSIRSGEGQIIDAAMTDGSALLMAMIYSFKSMGIWQTERGGNLFDGSAHFYGTYQCSDGKWVSIGAIEPQFYALLLEKTQTTLQEEFTHQMDPMQWPPLKEKLAVIFRTKTRDDWCAIMENTDVCFARFWT